jgi:hypothetical protein
MQPSILDRLNAQNGQLQQQSSNIINNPATSQPQSAPMSGASAGDITNALGGNNQPTPVAAPTGDNSENWLTKLLPTAGSILGGIVAAPLDLATGGLASVGGAGLGGAAGKGIEDLLTGKQAGADVLGAGAEGLVGGGIGKAGEALIGAAGKGLAGAGEKGIENATAKTEAESAVNDAQAVRNTYGGIKKSMLENSNLNDVLDTAKNLGLNHLDPTALKNTGSEANDILNETLNNSLSRAGGVDTSDYTGLIKNAINKNANVLGSTDPVALARGRMGPANNPATNLLQDLNTLGQGRAGLQTTDPVQLRTLISDVGSKMADAKPGVSATTGAVDPVQRATYTTLQDVYNGLKAKLNTPEVNQAISEAKGGLQPEDVSGNSLLATHLNDIVDNAKTPQDLYDGLAQFTNMGKIGQAGEQLAKNPASAAALTAAKQNLAQTNGTTLDSMGNPIADLAASASHPLVSAAGNMLKAVGSPSAGGAGSAGAIKIGNILQRIAPNSALAGGELAATSPNFGGPANAGSAVGQGGIVQNIPMQGNDITSLLNSKNPENALLGVDLLRAEHPVLGQGSVLGGAGDIQAAGTLNKVNTAQGQLSTLVNMLNQAGGAQGPIGGNLAKFASMFTGGPAANYDQQAQQLVSQLNGTLGTNIAAPSITSNQQSANDVLQQLQSALMTNGAGA